MLGKFCMLAKDLSFKHTSQLKHNYSQGTSWTSPKANHEAPYQVETFFSSDPLGFPCQREAEQASSRRAAPQHNMLTSLSQGRTALNTLASLAAVQKDKVQGHETTRKSTQNAVEQRPALPTISSYLAWPKSQNRVLTLNYLGLLADRNHYSSKALLLFILVSLRKAQTYEPILCVRWKHLLLKPWANFSQAQR